MNSIARREAVARILRSPRRIGTQEELLEALRDAGFDATQATLSRDLARLGARRVSLPQGGTVYELGAEPDAGLEGEAAAPDDSLAAVSGMVTTVQANASLVFAATVGAWF